MIWHFADVCYVIYEYELFELCMNEYEEEEIKNYLSSKNLKMSKIETRFGAEGSGPSVYVEDPEGNSIELKGVERS